MFCPQCRVEYDEQFSECPECHVSLEAFVTDPHTPGEFPADADLEVRIRTGLVDPVAISLVKSLFEEAGLTSFDMDRNVAARQEGGNFMGWWDVRVPKAREAEAREILQSVEQMK